MTTAIVNDSFVAQALPLPSDPPSLIHIFRNIENARSECDWETSWSYKALTLNGLIDCDQDLVRVVIKVAVICSLYGLIIPVSFPLFLIIMVHDLFLLLQTGIPKIDENIQKLVSEAFQIAQKESLSERDQNQLAELLISIKNAKGIEEAELLKLIQPLPQNVCTLVQTKLIHSYIDHYKEKFSFVDFKKHLEKLSSRLEDKSQFNLDAIDSWVAKDAACNTLFHIRLKLCKSLSIDGLSEISKISINKSFIIKEEYNLSDDEFLNEIVNLPFSQKFVDCIQNRLINNYLNRNKNKSNFRNFISYIRSLSRALEKKYPFNPSSIFRWLSHQNINKDQCEYFAHLFLAIGREQDLSPGEVLANGLHRIIAHRPTILFINTFQEVFFYQILDRHYGSPETVKKEMAHCLIHSILVFSDTHYSINHKAISVWLGKNQVEKDIPTETYEVLSKLFQLDVRLINEMCQQNSVTFSY